MPYMVTAYTFMAYVVMAYMAMVVMARERGWRQQPLQVRSPVRLPRSTRHDAHVGMFGCSEVKLEGNKLTWRSHADASANFHWAIR